MKGNMADFSLISLIVSFFGSGFSLFSFFLHILLCTLKCTFFFALTSAFLFSLSLLVEYVISDLEMCASKRAASRFKYDISYVISAIRSSSISLSSNDVICAFSCSSSRYSCRWDHFVRGKWNRQVEELTTKKTSTAGEK